MLLLANWKRWWPTCLCISAMNLLRSIFPLWSTSTSAMMVFTCSERPISRILSRRHWKWLQKHRGGRVKTTSVSVGLYPRVLNSWGISLEPRRPVLFWGVSKCTTLFFLRVTTISSILPCRKVWKPPSSLRWNRLEYPVRFCLCSASTLL